MTELRLWIPCIPPKATSQMKGMTRTPKGVRFFKKAEVAQAERTWLTLVYSSMPRDWKKIDSGPVLLEVSFTWPWRKSEPLSERTLGIKHMDVKPDCSNIIKLLEDCLTMLKVWRDDAQVAVLHVSKMWGDKPGIFIRVERITKYKEEEV